MTAGAARGSARGVTDGSVGSSALLGSCTRAKTLSAESEAAQGRSLDVWSTLGKQGSNTGK
jgi:hypothetical protein